MIGAELRVAPGTGGGLGMVVQFWVVGTELEIGLVLMMAPVMGTGRLGQLL